MVTEAKKSLREDLSDVLNRHSQENQSDTPDFILASFLTYCLQAFDVHVRAREDWYGHRHAPAGEVTPGQDTQLEL